MAGGRAAGAAAFLMKMLRETKGKINKDSCVFERVGNMDYTIVPDESVPEGTVIVGLKRGGQVPDESVPEGTVIIGLNKEDKVDIEKQDKLKQELQKELLAIKRGAPANAAVAEVGLNTVGLGDSSDEKDPVGFI